MIDICEKEKYDGNKNKKKIGSDELYQRIGLGRVSSQRDWER